MPLLMPLFFNRSSTILLPDIIGKRHNNLWREVLARLSAQAGLVPFPLQAALYKLINDVSQSYFRNLI